MSTGVAEVLLRVRDEASKGIGEVGQAAKGAAEDAKKLEEALDDAQRGMAPAGDAAERVGRAAGSAGSNAMKLAGALSLVSPAAGDVARNAGDLADVIEVASVASGALGVSMATLAAVALPLGLAIGGLVYAHNQAAEAAEKHKEAVEALGQAQRAAFDPSVALAGAVGDLQGQAAVLSGSLDELTARQQREAEQLRVLAREAQATAAAELRAAEAAFEHVKGYAETSRGYRDAASALQAARERLDRVVDSTDKLNAILPEVQAGERAKAEAVRAAAAADEAAAAAAAKTAEAERARAEAAAEATRRLRELQEALDAEAAIRFAREVDDAALALAAFDAALAGVDLTNDISATQDFAMAEADLALELGRGAINADQYAEALERLREERRKQREEADRRKAEEEAKQAEGEARKADEMSDGTKAVMHVNGLASGWAQGPSAGLQSLGPWGVMVDMLVTIVSNLSELMDSYTQYHQDMWDGFARIPEVLAEKLPDAIRQGMMGLDALDRFLDSLADRFDDIVAGIVRAAIDVMGGVTDAIFNEIPKAASAFLQALVDPETWKKVAASFVEGIKENWANVKEGGGVANILTGGLAGIVGSFDVGTKYVPRDGLALVHKGERIFRPDQGVAASSSVQIQVNATAITADGARELVRELGRYMGPSGIGLSWEPT